MTTRQLRELEFYYAIEPFGQYRDELRCGKQMALLSNINRDSKVKPEAFKAIDFMDYIDREPERVYTDEELEEYAKKIFGC